MQAVAGEGDAAFERLAVYDLVWRRGALAGLSLGADVVLQAEVQRVHTEIPGGAVHQAFEGEVALGRAESAVGAGGGTVGVGQMRFVLDVGAVVEVEDALPGTSGHACAGGEVCAGVQQGAGLDGCDAAVGLEPGADVYLCSVAHSPGDELVLSGVFETHGTARPLGERGCNARQPCLVLVAVARAEEGADDAHAMRGQAQRTGEGIAVYVDAAGGLPDGQVGIFVLAP